MDNSSAHVPAVDVAGVGLNATDCIIRLPAFPLADSKMEFISAQTQLGGQVASAMVACSKWGLRARYIGKAGDDAAARKHIEEFQRTAVDARVIPVPNCPSQSAYILVDETSGERTILWGRDARLALQPSEIQREWITSARGLLVDGHDTAAAATAAKFARAEKIPVIADVDNIYSGLEVLLEAVDYLIGSRQFPTRLTGDENILAALRRIATETQCPAVGATLGSEGAIVWHRGRFLYAPAFRVSAVDTTGAGDVFHGAFLYGVVQGWPLPRTMDFSCAAAALNCIAPGARGHIATIEEIENLMMTGTRNEPAFDPEEIAFAER
jgi:sulfofructose kinase